MFVSVSFMSLRLCCEWSMCECVCMYPHVCACVCVCSEELDWVLCVCWVCSSPQDFCWLCDVHPCMITAHLWRCLTVGCVIQVWGCQKVHTCPVEEIPGPCLPENLFLYGFVILVFLNLLVSCDTTFLLIVHMHDCNSYLVIVTVHFWPD